MAANLKEAIARVIEGIISFTENPKFTKEINALCSKPLDENADKMRLMDVIIAHLNRNNQSTDDVITTDSHPGDYDSSVLLIEQVCETLLDGVKEGLAVKDINTLITVFLKFLLALQRYESRLIEYETAASVLKGILMDTSATMFTSGDQRSLSTICGYVCNTILPNYQLYHFLLTETQEIDRTSEHVTIGSVPPSQELSSGCLEEKWKRQQKLSSREKEFEKDVKEISMVQEQMATESARVGQACDELMDELINKETGDESLGNAISMVTKMEADVVAKDLLVKVKRTEMDLDFALDKMNIMLPDKKT